MRQFLLSCVLSFIASHYILPSEAGPLDSHKRVQRISVVGGTRILERQLPPSPEFECHLTNSPDPFLTCTGLLTKYNVTLAQFHVYNEGVGSFCENYQAGEEYCVRASRVTPVSVDASCGTQAETRVTCVGSEFGECCSAGGWCGSTPEHCGIGYCQEGNCPGLGYSIDGKCGPGVECGGPYGHCCSNTGWCGSTPDHCGVGNCQSGACEGSPTTTVTTTPTATTTPQDPPGGISPDGTCGYDNEYTCQGSTYGNCCSAAGWCGNTKFYCSDLLGCQSEFGVCDQTVLVTVTVDPGASTATTTTST